MVIFSHYRNYKYERTDHSSDIMYEEKKEGFVEKEKSDNLKIAIDIGFGDMKVAYLNKDRI